MVDSRERLRRTPIRAQHDGQSAFDKHCYSEWFAKHGARQCGRLKSLIATLCTSLRLLKPMLIRISRPCCCSSAYDKKRSPITTFAAVSRATRDRVAVTGSIGGANLGGYWAIGSVESAITPTSVMTMLMTPAKDRAGR